MKKMAFLFLAVCGYYTASSQLMAGISVGTFNIPGARNKFKGFGPTAKLEYVMSERTSAYLDASLYNKEEETGETTTVTDETGAFIGEADTKTKYSIKHLQFGFKAVMGNDLSEKGFSFFLGAGVAVSMVKTTYKYTLPGYDISDSKYNNNVFGFHFNTGVQYNFNPIIIELKANFDLMLKPLVSGESYIISGSRLGVLIPLTK